MRKSIFGGKTAQPAASAARSTKYVFEADKRQLEKPTESQYVSCAPARVIVFAKGETEAKTLAEKKLRSEYAGSGTVLGEAVLVESYAPPIDWSYGYGENRKSGRTGSIGNLVGKNVIR